MKKRIFILSGIVALIDQLIKILVVNSLAGTGSVTVVKEIFYLTYVKNEGAAWGIFSGSRWFLILISIISIYAIIKYFLLDVQITKLEFVSYGLLLGGIVGNLIDRIIYGYVIDYMDFSMGAYRFPVFNLADTIIVLSITLVVIHLMINAVKQRRKK